MIDRHQRKAVELYDCQALLLAGPGCGKTHILARRVFHANTVRGVGFDKMLCLTFTNRAAREMARRVHEYVGAAPRGLFIGNIHSFCFRFLHANRLVSPDTSVIDEEDVAEYLGSVHGITDSRGIKGFLDKAAYAYQLEHDHPDRVVRRPQSYPTEEDYERIEAYTRFKESNRLVDYDDILRMTFTALLDGNADRYAMRGYTWVQIDEVQDMTPLQLAIIDGVCERRRTALYLGDEQQAIFGFLGAGGRALDEVKRQCGPNVLRLQRNYRSPDYLVNLCNRIAVKYLGIDAKYLPEAVAEGKTPHPLLTWTGDAGTLLLMAAAQARRLLKENPTQNTAVLVHTNRQAQEMADILADHGLEFFHVSRPDMFHQAAFKTIWAHLAVVQRPTRHQEWARLLYQTRAVRTLSGSRQLMNLLRDGAMSGDELLWLDRPTVIERFCGIMSDDERPIVVVDTETTGLDVWHDDVIQIAAIKLQGGRETEDGRFCVFIRTERSIPRFLSDGTDNPMRKAYADADLLEPEEAFARFADFLGDDSVIAGHNLAFDRAILRHNYARRCDIAVPPALCDEERAVDTLQLSQLLLPTLRSHKLANLIAVLKLEGVNSHNALDDVAATAELMNALEPMARSKAGRHAKIRNNGNVRKAAMRFRAAYEPLYSSTRSMMEEDSGSLTEALQEARNYFSSRGYIGPIRYWGYFLEMIESIVTDKETEPNLKAQADANLCDLTAFNESDLLANGIVSERLSVMTVHKAKGLEMDNVIVLDARSRPGTAKDYARLLYVAFSRAKERLYVGRTPWTSDMMLDSLLESFEEVPKDEVALAVREESAFHF